MNPVVRRHCSSTAPKAAGLEDIFLPPAGDEDMDKPQT
jgi:hypothetical protein